MATTAVMVTLLLAGCSPGSPTTTSSSAPPRSAGYQLPASIKYVDHWVATPSADLMSADGTFIRAFAEAYEARIFNIDGKKGSYPGFVNADRTDDRESGGGGDWYGYAVRWVIGFAVAPDGSATADVCETSSITQDESVHEDVLRHRLVYQRSGKTPPTDQHGPARAPSESVFGDWQATEFSSQVPITRDSLEPCLSSRPPVDEKNVENSPGWPAVVK